MKGVKGIEYGKRLFPRVSDEVYNALNELAYKNRITLSEYVRNVLEEHVKNVTNEYVSNISTKDIKNAIKEFNSNN